MVTWDEVKAVFDVLKDPKKRRDTRAGGDMSQVEPFGNRALTVIMDLLAITENPALDSNRLQQAWSQYRDQEDTRYRNHHQMRQYPNRLYGENLAKFLSKELLPQLRDMHGYDSRNRKIGRMGLVPPPYTDTASGWLQTISDHIENNVYRNPIVTDAPYALRLAFYRLLTNTRTGIETANELAFVLGDVEANDVIPLIQQYDAYNLASLFHELPRDDNSAVVIQFVNYLVELRPELDRLALINALSHRCNYSFDILKAQSLILTESIREELRPALQNVYQEISKLYVKQLDLSDNATPLHKALRLTNQLLLSTPGDERQRLLTEYQNLANTMQGHANPKWQALGLSMAALGGLVAGLGLAAVISGAAIPIAFGVTALLLGFGIYAYNNRQTGTSKILQTMHDHLEEQDPQNPSFLLNRA